MKVVFAVFTLLVIVPVSKLFMDLMTDANGPIANATANTTVNGTATAWGQAALTFWQFFPYFLGLVCVVWLYKLVTGSIRRDREQK